MIEAQRLSVGLILARHPNPKLTKPADLDVLEALAKRASR